MANVSETIPEALQSEVGAALSWFNATQYEVFRVTGIMDAPALNRGVSTQRLGSLVKIQQR